MFPSHNVDPRLKNKKDWCLQYSKAALKDYEKGSSKIGHKNKAEYAKIKSYAIGRQDTAKYKKPAHVDEQNNSSLGVLDFTILNLLKGRRQVVLGMLQKRDYNAVITPIDMLAADRDNAFFAQQKAKVLMREAISKSNPELLDSPALKLAPGEAESLDEIEMQMQFPPKFNDAMEAEMAIRLVWEQNNLSNQRTTEIEDVVDFGVAAFKDWMEPDGKIKFRNVEIDQLVMSFCQKKDFSDIRYCGEIQTLAWEDFREQADGQFSEEEFEQIFEKSKSRNNNDRYATYGKITDKSFKVDVLDLEWFSVDEIVYEDGLNKYGNPVFSKADWKNKGKEGYRVQKRKNVYRSKWVLDTDFIYDYGLSPYMKRGKGLNNTELSYHIVATNFDNMTASGLTEDLIPIADQMQISWLKLQNIRNDLQAWGWDIDLTALEDVSLGAGGQKLSPKEIIQMFRQTGNLVNRRSGGMEANKQNQYKSIEFIPTNYGALIADAWNDFNNNYYLLQKATGLNEVTDTTTADAKNLTATTNAMIASTNNAFYHFQDAERDLLERLSKACLCRLQRAIKLGKVEGTIRALGTNTVKYFALSPDIDLSIMGLKLENRPTQEERQMLWQDMVNANAQGLLLPQDRYTIMNVDNLKQAEQMVAFQIGKRIEQKEQQARMLQRENGDIQVQSAQEAEKAKRETIGFQTDEDIRKAKEIHELTMELERLKLGVKDKMNTDQNQAQKDKARIQKDIPVSDPIPQTPIPEEEPNNTPEEEQGEPEMVENEPPEQVEEQD